MTDEVEPSGRRRHDDLDENAVNAVLDAVLLCFHGVR